MANELRRPPRGPGMGGAPAEKAKDFKGSMKRLFVELKSFRILIIIALMLAIVGSMLSVIAPNKLRDLTDEISKGLVINSENLEKLTTKIASNLEEGLTLSAYITTDATEEEVEEICRQIESMDGVEEVKLVTKQEALEEMKSRFSEHPELLEQYEGENNIFPDSVRVTINGIEEFNNVESQISEIEINGKNMIDDITNGSTILISIIQTIKSGDIDDVLNTTTSISESQLELILQELQFKEIQIDEVTISKDDQIEFLKVMITIPENASASEVYSRIEQMPQSVQDIVEPAMNIDTIKNIALFLATIYITSALFTFIESISMTIVANKFAKRLRSNISTKINKLPLKYFDKNMSGDILSRVTNDVDTIAQSMNQSLATFVSSITLFIGTIIMMFYTDWKMALTAIISSSIGFAFMSIVLKKSQKYFTARQEELGKLNGHIEEVYSGLNVIKVYNGRKEVDEKFDDLNKKVYEANRKSQFLSGLMQPMMNFIGNFGYVAICIVGALLTMNNMITFGVIVAFITYVRLFTSPLSQIAQAMTLFQSTAAASERVFEFIDEKEMPSQDNINKSLDKEKAKGNIEFENVVFKYEDSDKPTITGFSAKAKPGQKIAIVGPTGAGKTTLVNLLMKFYDIDSGDIKIDGISIKELKRENIHSLFTMVLQDTWLFNGTVKENIIYNNENITDEQVENVCKTVGLDHFIKTLSHGYNSKISDNDSISAGQRQLLTIARGILQNTPFLILDEATSNVDTRTEELVQSAMDKLTEGKTSFIIAHRLSTIKNADLILVMNNGNIIEQGNHGELMEKKGFYADLYNSQFEL